MSPYQVPKSKAGVPLGLGLLRTYLSYLVSISLGDKVKGLSHLPCPEAARDFQEPLGSWIELEVERAVPVGPSS